MYFYKGFMSCLYILSFLSYIYKYKQLYFKYMKAVKSKVALVLCLLMLFAFSGCMTQTIKEVKNDDNIGQDVAVKGQVIETVKLGDISGYVLKDNNGDTINVATSNLPQEGDTVTAKGKLRKTILLGYYIEVED